jgi:hypothetical protein
MRVDKHAEHQRLFGPFGMLSQRVVELAMHARHHRRQQQLVKIVTCVHWPWRPSHPLHLPPSLAEAVTATNIYNSSK